MNKDDDSLAQPSPDRFEPSVVSGGAENLTRHPGAYIEEEMRERGMLAGDLAQTLGMSDEALSRILAGGEITPDIARALGTAFDVDAEFFLNLQRASEVTP